MTLESTLERAKRSEERLWRSTCEITRPGPGEVRLDPVTLKNIRPPATTVYSGPCQARPLRQDRDNEAQLGGTDVEVNDFVIKVPLDTAVHRLDHVVITSSPDPRLVGSLLVVKAVPASEWAPCRRLVCEEVTQ